jgi:predicted TIM-barrel fold metal-dependent hydrolase
MPTISKPLPKGTWDSHMHIVEAQYSLSAKAQYKPNPHTLSDARSFYSPLGIENVVIVQPSVYGTDNSCTLNALRTLTPRHGRAVVEIDPTKTSLRTLQSWHELGVRGVRVNLVSVSRDLDEQEMRRELGAYARLIRLLKWVLELYIPMKSIPILEPIVRGLGVTVCIDHFGSPSLPSSYAPSKAIDPYDLPGFSSLVRLLRAGKTYVKISGFYRISRDADMRDLEALGKELLRVAPDRCVYATDWPHTRFENIDSVPFIEMCYRWCGEGTDLEEKLFRTNAEVLWGVDGTERSAGLG